MSPNSVLGLGLLALVLGSGCTAQVPTSIDEPAAEVCGGAVCFAPAATRVRSDAGELQLSAWRGDGDACAVPASAPVPVGGLALEIDLHGAAPGLAIPIKPRSLVQTGDSVYATARSVRIESAHGRALADEEAVEGTVTLIARDAAGTRARVHIDAKWSSGISRGTDIELATAPCVQ